MRLIFIEIYRLKKAYFTLKSRFYQAFFRYYRHLSYPFMCNFWGDRSIFLPMISNFHTYLYWILYYLFSEVRQFPSNSTSRNLFFWLVDISDFIIRGCGHYNNIFCLTQVAGYLYFVIKSYIALIRFMKAVNRFSAMYFPIQYRTKFTIKWTIVGLVVGAITFLMVYLPLIFFRGNWIEFFWIFCVNLWT
jgi:hypothetical protein